MYAKRYFLIFLHISVFFIVITAVAMNPVPEGAGAKKSETMESIDATLKNLATEGVPHGVRTRLWTTAIARLRLTSASRLDLVNMGATANELAIIIDTLPEEVQQKLRVLDFGSNGLTHVPVNIGKLCNVLAISFANNSLSTLDSSLVPLTKLKMLTLAKNAFVDFPQDLLRSTNLEALDFGSNPLKNLPKEFSQLIHLQKLYFEFTHLTTLPTTIGELSELKLLDICNNTQLTSVPWDSLVRLANLEKFLADDDVIVYCLHQLMRQPVPAGVPAPIWSLAVSSLCQSKPQALKLRVPGYGNKAMRENGFANKSLGTPDESLSIVSELVQETTAIKMTTPIFVALIRALPACIRVLISSLHLAQNLLTAIPPEIKFFTQLIKVDFSENQLTLLPEELGQLIHLERLFISNNRLSRLPDSLSKLKDLKAIDISYNSFVAFPCVLSTLAQLILLKADFNGIRELPPCIGAIKQLEYLNFSFNQLERLPNELFSLKDLNELYLDGNLLTEVSPALGNLTLLTKLELNVNVLERLPEELTNLKRLRKLGLSCNRLMILPEGIGELGDLKVLDITHNRFWNLPLSITKLTKLTELRARVNPFIFLDDTRVIKYLCDRTVLLIDEEVCAQCPPLCVKEREYSSR
jgi:Leucine-rich repeat (LRR) protein